MGHFDAVDFFSDAVLHRDPYPYYEYLRSQGPAVRLPKYNVVAVTSYDEALKVFRDDECYSAINATYGPLPPIPFVPEGDDITPQIEAHRHRMVNGALIMSMDRPRHAAHRSLLMGLITPRRLKENEEFMWRLADRQIDTFAARGAFEAVTDLSHPLATLVIADLLGVPEGDHERFLQMLPSVAAQLGGGGGAAYNPLAQLDAAMSDYIVDRRNAARSDILTNLAVAKFPDGTTPEVSEVVNIASFLFAAGQDTTVRLIATSLRILGEDPALQLALRNDRARIPGFIEEALRFESPSKVDSRLARVRTRIGDINVEPGTTVMIMIGAVNRDPGKFERPNEFNLDRPNAREHLAFGRGIHACAGAPLARSEARIALHCIFDRTREFRISETMHGPQGARRYEYTPRYTARGLQALHMEFAPA